MFNESCDPLFARLFIQFAQVEVFGQVMLKVTLVSYLDETLHKWSLFDNIE